MKFVCHRQKCLGVRLTDSACAKCGMQMTVTGLLRYFSKSFRSFFAKRLRIICPRCRAWIPAFKSTCPNCRSTLTVEGVFEKTVGPHRERVRQLLTPTDTSKRYLPWVHLVVSAIVFWVTFGVLERHYADGWIQHAMLSVVYLAVFLLIFRWVIPQRTFHVIIHFTGKRVKLGLALNFLTGLFLLQMYLTEWWSRSLMLAGLFVATWFGALLFCALLWPSVRDLGGIFDPPTSTETAYDPRAPQGRNVGMD